MIFKMKSKYGAGFFRDLFEKLWPWQGPTLRVKIQADLATIETLEYRIPEILAEEFANMEGK